MIWRGLTFHNPMIIINLLNVHYLRDLYNLTGHTQNEQEGSEKLLLTLRILFMRATDIKLELKAYFGMHSYIKQ